MIFCSTLEGHGGTPSTGLGGYTSKDDGRFIAQLGSRERGHWALLCSAPRFPKYGATGLFFPHKQRNPSVNIALPSFGSWPSGEFARAQTYTPSHTGGGLLGVSVELLGEEIDRHVGGVSSCGIRRDGGQDLWPRFGKSSSTFFVHIPCVVPFGHKLNPAGSHVKALNCLSGRRFEVENRVI